MARSKGPKFYAVAIGRDGPRIYEEWSQAEKAVSGFKGAKHKSMSSETEAKEWLAGHLDTVTVTVRQPDMAITEQQPPYAPSTALQNESSFLISSSPEREIPTSTPEFKPRLTTRYSPYPSSSSRSGPPSSRASAHGVPAIKPPRSFKSSQPSSSQANPISISSDVEEEDLMNLDTARPALSDAGWFGMPIGPQARAALEKAKLEEAAAVAVKAAAPKSVPTKTVTRAVKTNTNHAKHAEVEEVIVEPIPINEPKLSEEQERILKRITDGESIFFTGSAGVGKSVLTRAIIRALKTRHSHPNEVAVTATTGIAATNIGGCTLHSWAGLGLAKMSVDKLYHSVVGNKSKAEVLYRWIQCKALIIDEVSMLHGTFFDKLEELARKFRNNSLPFGGIQLVITGDFFQLPPIPDFAGYGKPPQEVKFAFECRGWKSAVKKMVILKQVFRQRDDEFVNILNEMRMGRASPEACETLSKLSRKVVYEDGVEPTCLFARRNDVLRENTRRLKLLEGATINYKAQDISGKKSQEPYGDKYPTENELLACLDKNTLVESMIDMKVGAQVMLVKNLKSGIGLVNGSIGRVIGFASAAQINQEASGNVAPQQYAPDFPDIDAELNDHHDDYAEEEEMWMSLHGQNSDSLSKPSTRAKLSPHATSGAGAASAPRPSAAAQPKAAARSSIPQPNTAAKSAEAPLPPSLANIKIASAQLTEKEKQKLKAELGYGSGDNISDEELQAPAMPGTWPVVEFTNGQKMLLPPMDFTVEDANGRLEAKRIQVPLILAWALSIHKSQGQTLERVKVDLGDIFETGQAYVALSRATQMETLQVLRFYPTKVKAHQKVIKWYSALSNSGKL